MQHPQKQKEPSEKYTLRSPHRCCHIHILALSSGWLSEQNMIFQIFFIFLFSLFIHFHNLLLHLIHFLLNSLNYYCHCFYFCFFFFGIHTEMLCIFLHSSFFWSFFLYLWDCLTADSSSRRDKLKNHQANQNKSVVFLFYSTTKTTAARQSKATKRCRLYFLCCV